MREGELSRTKSFLDKLNLPFEHVELFFTSLVHSSYANEQKQSGRKDISSNERLEFLGDAVVDLLVCDILYETYPWASEGEMSRVKAAVASEKILSMIAREYGLGEYLFLGKGEEMSGGRNRDSILADALEALLGAVFLVEGFSGVKSRFESVFKRYTELVMEGKLLFDYKTALQELTQKKMKKLPEYRVVSKSGNGFEVEVVIEGQVLGKGHGRSKKEAEKEAAKEAYRLLKGE